MKWVMGDNWKHPDSRAVWRDLCYDSFDNTGNHS